MKLLPAILLLALSGCRMAIIPMPGGKTAYVGSLLTDPQWASCRINPDGSMVLEGYQSKVNAEAAHAAISAVTEGAVRGFLK